MIQFSQIQHAKSEKRASDGFTGQDPAPFILGRSLPLEEKSEEGRMGGWALPIVRHPVFRAVLIPA